jgi:hypothetical protein
MPTDPVKTLQLYMALKAHFSSVSFDAVKGNGKFKNANKEQLEKRNDKSLIAAFGKKCDNPQQVASVLVANFAYGNDYPFNDIDRAFSLHNKWQKIRQSLTKTFSDDIVYLNIHCEDHNREFKDLFEVNGVPTLFQLTLSGKIHIETVAILDRLMNFIPLWMEGLPLWKKEFLKIKKLQSFIVIDEQKFRRVLKERSGNE